MHKTMYKAKYIIDPCECTVIKELKCGDANQLHSNSCATCTKLWLSLKNMNRRKEENNTLGNFIPYNLVLSLGSILELLASW